jgi:hypothetical protein
LAVLGGPLLEDTKSMTANGAMMLLAVESVRQILEADPARSSGLIEIAEIRPLVITAASWKPQPAQ